MGSQKGADTIKALAADIPAFRNKRRRETRGRCRPARRNWTATMGAKIITAAA
jgi:hypothetical protein